MAITRIGVTFPPDLLQELDDVIEKIGYSSRSKALQESARAFIAEHRWLRDQRGEKTGVVVLVYDHKSVGLQDHLTDTEHEHAEVIRTSTHVHLTRRDCLEAIVVRGEAARIRELTEKLRSRRGVKQVKLAIVSS